MEQVQDRKNMIQMIAGMATGYFKSNQKRRRKRKTNRGGGKKARKEDTSSNGIDNESNNSGSVEEVENRIVRSVHKSGGDDNSRLHRVFQHSAD